MSAWKFKSPTQKPYSKNCNMNPTTIIILISIAAIASIMGAFVFAQATINACEEKHAKELRERDNEIANLQTSLTLAEKSVSKHIEDKLQAAAKIQQLSEQLAEKHELACVLQSQVDNADLYHQLAQAKREIIQRDGAIQTQLDSMNRLRSEILTLKRNATSNQTPPAGSHA